MNWQRLDRDTTLKTIDLVKSATEAGLFSAATSEVQRARLPFYETLFLYKIINHASLPSFTFEYLGDGQFFHYLDGTEHAVYSVNDRGALSLNPGNVLNYLEFFMSHVIMEGDEVAFIRDAADMPLLESLDPDDAYIVTKNHRPPEVSYDAGFDKYTVEADIYSEGQMLRALLEVTGSGRVTIVQRKMIVNTAGSGIMA